MVSTAATSLQDTYATKVRELDEALAGFSSETAGRRPADGEWCVKEALSHLCGEADALTMYGFRRFIEEDEPLIGIVTGLPYYSPERQAMSFEGLASKVRAQYGEIASYLGSLSQEQLERKARVPLLKDTPFGEHVTLAQWAQAAAGFHLMDHINQIRAARDRLNA
jgi:hypothetical protein